MLPTACHLDDLCLSFKRLHAGVAGLVDRNKKLLALASASLLALVPWMQISKAVSSDVTVSLGALAAVVAAGVAVHIGFLAFNTAAVRLLRIGGRDRLACECPSICEYPN